MAVPIPRDPAPATGGLVVRRPGSWALAPSTRDDVVPVSTSALLALVQDAGGAEVGPAERLPRPLDEETVLEPRAAVLARIGVGALEVEGTDGRLVRLDPLDLCLLDVIDQWISVGQVIDAVGDRFEVDNRDRALLARRVARIADTGRVRVARRPDREHAGDPEGAFDEGAFDEEAFDEEAFDEEAFDEEVFHEFVAVTPPADAAVPPSDPPSPAAPTTDLDEDGAHAVDYLEDPFPGGAAGPVPVYAVWPVQTGPVLALGMLTAAARHHDGGRLAEWYEIRRPEAPASFFAHLDARRGPAVLLLSNYVWSVDQNLAIARRARALRPDLVIIHGGPSTPKYEGDVERFFAAHAGLVDITVRGEGESTLAAILDALGPSWPDRDLGRLREVTGLSYRDPATGAIVRTGERDRVAELDELPSAYLTGEFDHLPPSAWDVPSGLLGLIFESNRGCPYGCTFCDWGSSTLSRIRKFDLERVDAEMRWAARRGHHAWTISDANFGIISRDVEIAERMAALKAEYGHPSHFGFNVAKNTTKHLTAILDRLVGASIVPHFSLALQTRDEATLEVVERTNISTDHYLALAAAFRRRGLPLDADVMVGLPGQTVESFAGDLQFLLDHEIPARMWITELLPNAPMNEPSYRRRHAIETDEHHVVVSTATFTTDDRRTMMRLRHAYTAFERFGILRYVVRYAQWDHDVPAMDILRRIVERSDRDPDRYPLLNWVARYFDYFTIPPLGWRAFFAEVGRFLDEEFGIAPSAERDLVLAAQAFLLPDHDRRFPDALALDHDLVQYVRDHTRGLWGDGVPSGGGRLETYGPASLVVHGDPLDRCGKGLGVNLDPRNEVLTESFWIVGHWELDSPLATNYSEVAGSGAYQGVKDLVPTDLGDDAPRQAEVPPLRGAPVALRGAGSRALT